MATTALVTEILIVGLEAEAWLTLFVLAVFGTDWVELDALRGWEALVTILVLAVAYVLGIVVDRLADTAFRWVRGPDQPGFARKRLEVLHASSGMSPFVEYQRSRLRVARGTLFNLVPAALAAAAFLFWGTSVDARWLLAVLGGALVVLPVGAYATKQIGRAYENRLLDAYEIVSPSAGRRARELDTVERPRVVAAVCYRRRDGGVEFLLVRTKRGRKWTFPKGHVERGEAPAEAVAREAREEAGVSGSVADEPFTYYAYPAGSDGPGERQVAAYLLEVASQEAPGRGEKRRDPTWFDLEAAKAKLSEGGRERRYGEEHARVLAAALAELGAKT
jgi:8-oxo-dGTP pyrophosphatase MutT (NUDIX family)